MSLQNENNELTRFKRILYSTGLSKIEFADLLGIAKSTFTRYYNGNKDLQNLTRKLSNFGFNINWLYTGEGNMLFSCNLDSHLDEKHLNNLDLDSQKERINEWIIEFYGSVYDFEKAAKLDSGEFRQILLSKNKVYNYRHYRTLKTMGCNILWTINGEGDKLLNNTNGKMLKTKLLGKKK